MNLDSFKYYKEQMEIDYFTYFVKAYFALNAYIKAVFKGSDRDKINQLKEYTKMQRKFIEDLLEEELFRENLKIFKDALTRAEIKNDGVIISFQEVETQPFKPKKLETINKNKIIYDLEIVGGKDKKIKFKCLNKKNMPIGPIECSYKELANRLNKSNFTGAQRGIIESAFKKEIDNYSKNLVQKIDDLNNIDDVGKNDVYKGSIEIIYCLRNALFHSQVDAQKQDVQEVYKFAYFLLRAIILELPTIKDKK